MDLASEMPHPMVVIRAWGEWIRATLKELATLL